MIGSCRATTPDGPVAGAERSAAGGGTVAAVGRRAVRIDSGVDPRGAAVVCSICPRRRDRRRDLATTVRAGLGGALSADRGDRGPRRRSSAACGPNSTGSSTRRSSWFRSWPMSWSRPSSSSWAISSASAPSSPRRSSWCSASASSPTWPRSAGTSSRHDPPIRATRFRPARHRPAAEHCGGDLPSDQPAVGAPRRRSTSRRHGRRPSRSRSSSRCSAALLGFALAIQVRRTVNGDALSTRPPRRPGALLDGLQHREDELTTEIATCRPPWPGCAPAAPRRPRRWPRRNARPTRWASSPGRSPPTGPGSGSSSPTRRDGTPRGPPRRDPGTAQCRRRGLPGQPRPDRRRLGVHREPREGRPRRDATVRPVHRPGDRRSADVVGGFGHPRRRDRHRPPGRRDDQRSRSPTASWCPPCGPLESPFTLAPAG